MRVRLGGLAVALLVAASLAAGAGARSTVIVFFRTPSGNIGCAYNSADSTTPAELRCDIRSRIVPKPARPRNCRDLDWGDSYFLHRTGQAALTCHGDTAILPSAHALAYGKRWSRDGFTCLSQTAGLRCTNVSHHGFFLSRQHSYKF